MEIKKILFPIDLAGSSYRIVPQVRSIADQFDAELHLLFVVGTLERYHTFYVPHPSLDIMEKEGLKHAQRQLEEFAEKYFEDRPKVKTVVLRGDPVEQIRKYIESEGIDKVVVAYRRPARTRTRDFRRYRRRNHSYFAGACYNCQSLCR